MITGINIENFKGIRDCVKLDFRPIIRADRPRLLIADGVGVGVA